ncbi:MAG: glycosyltransferase family 39 protein [Anaerolineae bacterium]|jgi:4-amino-4-deoxy-L-arabinose transferase-like glycosyltransferase
MNQKRDRSCLLLAAVLLVYVALAAWYSVTIPLGEAPDEVPHFTYVRYLAQHGRLPTTEEEHEAFQPPLYYALGAALTFWIEDDPGVPFAVRANAHYDVTDPEAPKNLLLHTAGEDWPYRGWALAWHLVRLVSIALGAITIWAVFHLGRTLFPDRPAIPLTMAALTAFTPQFLFMSAVVNNDNAATAFSALVLWQAAAILHERQRAQVRKSSAVLGLVLGLAMLSKASLAALLPVAGLAILIACARCESATGAPQTTRFRGWAGRAAISLLAAFGLAALIAGWYFVRNWVLFGDPLGWSFLLEINARREGPLTPEVFAWLFKGVFRSFWLGWIGIQFDDLIYWLIGAACLVGLAGFVVWLVRRWRALDGGTRWTLILLGLHVAITLASLVQWTATVLGTDQGRLVFPILPTVMLILSVGWAWWARGRFQAGVLGGLAAGMLALAVLTPIRYIGPVHAPAPAAGQAELDAATPLNVEWDGVRLLGYRLENTEVRPGGKLVLYLYWEALQPIDQDLMALVQLVDQEGQFLMYIDGSPTAGRDTTDRWPPGVPLASRHILPVPDYGEPGEYALTIGLHPFGERSWLPVTGPDGSRLGDHLVLPVTVHLLAP